MKKNKREKVIYKNYWDMKKNMPIKEEYEDFLKKEGKENTPDNAHLFAIKKISSGAHDYFGFTERELIKLLAGKLPFMYD